MNTINSVDEYFASGPLTIEHTECSLCTRSFASTQGYPTHTLLCGHMYHTMCYYIYQDNEIKSCPCSTCEYPIWETYRNIIKIINQGRVDLEDELLQENMRAPEFKKDLKGFKAAIRNVTKNHLLVHNRYKLTYNQFIHRHLYTINQLQAELNTAILNVKNTDEIKQYKKALSAYRKKERVIFQRYHATFRDLYRRNIVNVSWRLRWVLERHRASFATYRYILRIKPGGKIWRDPIGDEV